MLGDDKVAAAREARWLMDGHKAGRRMLDDPEEHPRGNHPGERMGVTADELPVTLDAPAHPITDVSGDDLEEMIGMIDSEDELILAMRAEKLRAEGARSTVLSGLARRLAKV